jgi:hypothetical protein
MFSQRRLKFAAVCNVTTSSLVHSYRRSVGRTASIFRAKELRVGSGVHCFGLCTSVLKTWRCFITRLHGVTIQ